MSVQAVNRANSTTVSGNEYVAKTPEVFRYDLDGNLAQDGRWTYTWDAENLLVTMVSATANGSQQLRDQIPALIQKGEIRCRRAAPRRIVPQRLADSPPQRVMQKLSFKLNAASANGVVITYLWGTALSGSRQVSLSLIAW